MTTKKSKSMAMKTLEKIMGHSLTLGAMIEAIRLGEEESLEAFAMRLHISRSHLCDIEKGRKHVSPERAARFAKQLGYSEAQFVRLALQGLVDDAGLRMRVTLHAE